MHFDFLFNNFWDLSVSGLAQGSIYALIALGYDVDEALEQLDS